MRDFHLPGRSPVFASNGMCATSHPLAASTAIRILESGGNAVDAAIGAAVLLGFCEPQSTGLGGDCFVLLKRPQENRIIALNGSGRSPAAISSDYLRNQGMISLSENSIHSVTIPGAVDAFCCLSDDYGHLGLETSLAPAIRYAEEGIPVAPRVHFDWYQASQTLKGVARSYYLINGKVPAPGTLFRAPNQAEILRRIVQEGRRGFYEGEVAEDMVNSLRAEGGLHTLDDFSATACTYGEPICGNYRDYELIEHPPNGQGATAILLTNILNHFQLSEYAPFDVQRTHLETEAVKLAYDARDRFISDPDTSSRIDHMLAPATAKKMAQLINLSEPLIDLPNKTKAIHRETVLLIVVDKDLMAVVMIYSIFHSFGSGFASDKFGVNFQNRGAGFTLEAGHPNELDGNKRPMHTIIPAMLAKKGKIVMPFGVMGGQYQAAGHARLITNIADYDMNPQQALDGPRSFPIDGSLMLERGYKDYVFTGLKKLGHQVAIPDAPHGGGQAIWIDYDNGVLQGASDHRKDGCAIGY